MCDILGVSAFSRSFMVLMPENFSMDKSTRVCISECVCESVLSSACLSKEKDCSVNIIPLFRFTNGYKCFYLLLYISKTSANYIVLNRSISNTCAHSHTHIHAYTVGTFRLFYEICFVKN